MKNLFITMSCIVSMTCNEIQAQPWQPLTTGLQQTWYSRANCMTVYNNKLIVGGTFTTAGGVLANNIAAWDGSAWSSLQIGVSTTSGGQNFQDCDVTTTPVNVSALQVYNNELYVAGSFRNASGIIVNNIAKWNGTSWSDVGGGLKGGKRRVYGMTVYNNELYATGGFDTAGVVAVRNLAKWNGTTWSNVSTGLWINRADLSSNQFARGTCLGVAGNSLIVGGRFDTLGMVPAKNIGAWNGSSWSSYGFGIQSGGMGLYFGAVSMSIINNTILVGDCSTGLTKWNGSSWQSIGNGWTGAVNSVFDAGNFLVIGGDGSPSGVPATGVAKWNGLSYEHLTPTNTLTPNSGLGNVIALCSFNGYLYACGYFYAQVGYPALQLNNIARLNGIVGIKSEELKSEGFTVYPNPASGYFNLKVPQTNSKWNLLIINSIGEVVLNHKDIEESYNINLNTVSSGVYTIKLQSEEGVMTKKLLVNKVN